MRIVYFDIDCLRPDHLGCYGYDRPTSPTIDAIARQGVRFEHYYCASSPCLPSRTAWTSGRFGIRTGVVSNFGAGARFHIKTRSYGGPHSDNEMFMRQLRRHGYDTISFSNFADRHNALWFMYGWSEFHTPNLKGGQETGDEVNDKVLPWLRQNGSRENYFLHINYWDTHRCYKMDPSWANRFRNSPVTQAWPDEEAIQAHQSVTGPFTAKRQFRDHTSPFPLMPGSVSNRQDFEHMLTGYDAAIAYVDAHVQQVLDELERQRVLDDAVLIVSSDHGDAFGEHGIYSDHVCADECIHRIPLIIRWPGISAENKSSMAFIVNVDLAPTVCNLLDVPVPPEWDGKSCADNVKGIDRVDRDFLVWDTALYTVQRAVRTKSHLYIKTYDPFEYNNMRPVALFDMVNDPFQTRDVSAAVPGVVGECERLLDEWVVEQQAKSDPIPDPLEEVLRERGKI